MPAAAGHPGHRDRRRDRPIYRWMGQNLGDVGGSPSPWPSSTSSWSSRSRTGRSTRACAAIDVATLAEAARSLGAGWPRVIFQVILPNIRPGDPGGVRARDRARAGRVHDLVAAIVQHPPGRDLRARQARRVRLGRRVVRGADLRVRPAGRHRPRRARGAHRPRPPRRSPRHDRHVHRDRHSPARRCPGPVPGPAPLVRQGPRPRRPDHRHRAGRARRPSRSIRLRQDDRAPRAGRPR